MKPSKIIDKFYLLTQKGVLQEVQKALELVVRNLQKY